MPPQPPGVQPSAAAAAATLRRSHGFERPWHPLQVAAWVLFAALAVYFFAFLYPLLWRGTEYVAPISVVFCVSTAVALISGYLTARRDPADPALFTRGAASGFHGADRVHCYLCEVKVLSSSRHCRICNKCVEEFDHHCKWLNTCVGKANYRSFLTLVGSVAVETVLLLALSVAMAVEAFAEVNDFGERARDAFGSNLGPSSSAAAPAGVKTLLVVAGAVLAGLVAMVLQLGGFHIMLVSKGMTTYDFIVSEQRKQKARQIEMRQQQQQRESANPTAGAVKTTSSRSTSVSGSPSSNASDSSCSAASASSSGSAEAWPDSLDGNTVSSTLSVSDMAIVSDVASAGTGATTGGLPRVGSASRIVAVRAAPVHPGGGGEGESSMV